MADNSDTLDDIVRRHDPDRWLSTRFIADAADRADIVTLYALDHELARAPRASNPLLGEIRLTWWREALDEVFEDRSIRQHPTVQALAELVRRRGLARQPLEALIDARYRELDPSAMSDDEARVWSRATGGALAVTVAGLLVPGVDAEAARAGGAVWILARRLGGESWKQEVIASALADARREARRLPARAFPAVVHAALVGKPPTSELRKRARLVWAVARGRI